MTTMKSYMQIAANAVSAFGKDGKLDVKELENMLEIAADDADIDEDEIRVLRNILSKLRPHELNVDIRQRVREFERRFDVTLL